MVASGYIPRSPVWLRKIPSTVSGSQRFPAGPAARRALRVPAWRKIEYYLARSAVSRTFFRKFFRPSRGPQGAPPSGLRPFAAASSALYAPLARRGRETRPRTGCRQLQRGKAEGVSGGERHRAGASPPPHAWPPRSPDVSPRPIGAADSASYISKDRRPPSGGGLSAPSSRKRRFPRRRLSPVRFRQTSHGANTSRAAQSRLRRRFPPEKKNGRLRARPLPRAGNPSATVPGRFPLYIYREICLVATVEDALGLLYRTRQLAHGGRPSLQAYSQSSP